MKTDLNTTSKDILSTGNYELLYHEVSAAVDTLYQRRHSAFLESLLDKHLVMNAEMRALFKKPRAIMFRQVATPNHELELFFKTAEQLGLDPLVLEYHEDIFVSSHNKFKRSLGKMPIFQFTNAQSIDVIQYRTIVDFNISTGSKLKHVKTSSDESLISVHHDLLIEHIQKVDKEKHLYDASEWFNSHGSAKNYYVLLMALFIRHGILFENFVTTHDEASFADDVVIPAFKEVLHEFSLAPLIVRLIPQETETSSFTDYYPTGINRLLTERGYS
jgi:hypothetical protein